MLFQVMRISTEREAARRFRGELRRRAPGAEGTEERENMSGFRNQVQTERKMMRRRAATASLAAALCGALLAVGGCGSQEDDSVERAIAWTNENVGGVYPPRNLRKMRARLLRNRWTRWWLTSTG